MIYKEVIEYMKKLLEEGKMTPSDLRNSVTYAISSYEDDEIERIIHKKKVMGRK